jgi:hypothetical protein
MTLAFVLASFTVQPARANPYLGDDQPPDALIRRLTFTGEPAWLVIGEAFRSERLAAVRCGERVAAGLPATPIQTDLFADLRPGLAVLIYGAFPTKAQATAAASRLRSRGLATTVKQSGVVKPARPDTRSRLVRLWGKLSDDIKSPARIDIAGDNVNAVAYSTQDGWWQVWFRVDVGKRVQLELLAEPEISRAARAACEGGDPGGWFDRSASVTLEPATGDLFVGWSPSPDCHGE